MDEEKEVQVMKITRMEGMMKITNIEGKNVGITMNAYVNKFYVQVLDDGFRNPLIIFGNWWIGFFVLISISSYIYV